LSQQIPSAVSDFPTHFQVLRDALSTFWHLYHPLLFMKQVMNMTEAAELRRMKICRKTDKSAFENERLMKEVNELLHNFQRAFDSLVSKHEQFCNVV